MIGFGKFISYHKIYHSLPCFKIREGGLGILRRRKEEGSLPLGFWKLFGDFYWAFWEGCMAIFK